jgi:hypothetical protein
VVCARATVARRCEAGWGSIRVRVSKSLPGAKWPAREAEVPHPRN